MHLGDNLDVTCSWHIIQSIERVPEFQLYDIVNDFRMSSHNFEGTTNFLQRKVLFYTSIKCINYRFVATY